MVDISQAILNNPHLGRYVEEFSKAHEAPSFHERLTRDMKSLVVQKTSPFFACSERGSLRPNLFLSWISSTMAQALLGGRGGSELPHMDQGLRGDELP